MELPIRYRALAVNGTLHATSSPATRYSHTRNISSGGLLFLSQEAFQVGTVLELNFPVKDQLFSMHCRVVHTVQDPHSKLYETGVHFSNPDTVFKVKMAEQVYQIDEFRKSLSKQRGHIVTQEEAAREWIAKHSKEFAHFYVKKSGA